MNKINQYNEKGQPHDLWEYYYTNGQLWEKGTYINGKERGMWEHYHKDGTIMKQIFYSKHLYEQD